MKEQPQVIWIGWEYRIVAQIERKNQYKYILERNLGRNAMGDPVWSSEYYDKDRSFREICAASREKRNHIKEIISAMEQLESNGKEEGHS